MTKYYAINHSKFEHVTQYPGYNSAKASITRLRTGQYQSLRYDHTFEEMTPEEVIAAAMVFINDPLVADIDAKEFTKIGPFNRDPYDMWEPKVLAYYDKPDWRPDSEALLRATTKLYYELFAATEGNLNPVSLEEAFATSTKNTNLGLPYCTSKWMKNGKPLPHTIEYLARAEMFVETGDPSLIKESMLGHRSQPGGLDTVKNRPMMPSDHAETFACLRFQRALMPHIKKIPAYCGYLNEEELNAALDLFKESFDTVGISYGDDAVIKHDDMFYSLDFEAFDSSCQRELITLTLGAIGALFSHDGAEKDYTYFFKGLIELYCTQPLWTPKGFLTGEHGLFSGVALTSLVGLLVNRLFFFYLEERGAFDIHNVEQFKIALSEIGGELGLKLNPAKQMVHAEHFDFCQRRYSLYKTGGTYSAARVVGRVLFQESWLDTEKITEDWDIKDQIHTEHLKCLRMYMKLENAKNHENFKELVRFVFTHDRLRLSTQLALKVDKAMHSIKTRHHGREGLESFETFKEVLALEAELGGWDITTLDTVNSNKKTKLPYRGVSAKEERNATKGEATRLCCVISDREWVIKHEAIQQAVPTVSFKAYRGVTLKEFQGKTVGAVSSLFCMLFDKDYAISSAKKAANKAKNGSKQYDGLSALVEEYKQAMAEKAKLA